MRLGAGSGLFHAPVVAGGGGLLLDQFPGASVAYSLRLLSNTYSGDCVKVRRDSDNTEQSIGFSGGVVDMASITTFCGGASSGIAGYISTWYDQSVNGFHMTQTTHASQMQIVSDGDSFYMWNGHPRIYESGRKSMATGLFTEVSAGWSGTNFSCLYTEGGNWAGLFTGGNAGAYINGASYSPASNFKMWEKSGGYTEIYAGTITPTPNAFVLPTQLYNDSPGLTSLYVNGVLDGGVTTYTPHAYTAFIMPYNASNDETDPVELIFYPSDVGGDRAGIETNIIDYYGI